MWDILKDNIQKKQKNENEVVTQKYNWISAKNVLKK